MRKVFLFSCIIGVFCLSFFPTIADASFTQCRSETFLVKLSSFDESKYHIAGKLCWQGRLAGKTLQLLLPGVTYDHTYWDFAYQEPTYSYTTSAVHAGYAVLMIDRIGTGDSDHASPERITLPSEAYTIHQIVQQLRNGSVEDVVFPKIVLVGHSLGTLLAWQEAARYQDVDGIIASGWLHVLNPLFAPLVPASLYPAVLDPKFSSSNLPVGYLTTLPNTRGTLFYHRPDADAGVIALDETLKQTATDGEVATFALSESPVNTLLVHVPVLTAEGQNDSIFCSLLLSCNSGAALVQREHVFYNADACLEGYVLPQSGHDMNLHLNAEDWYNAANDWIRRRVGSSAITLPTEPCVE